LINRLRRNDIGNVFIAKCATVAKDIDGFFATVYLAPWKRDIRVAIYRRRVFHLSAKNFQLDLFDPSNGYWEYSAVSTNKSIGL
jgi:hypothetical protein